jgi:hypothetical protein
MQVGASGVHDPPTSAASTVWLAVLEALGVRIDPV